MLKRMAVIAVMALWMGHGAGQEKNRASLSQKQSDQKTSPTTPPEDNETSNPDARYSQAESPPWWKSPEWWLCFLGVPTLIFIGWQAKATADSAEAMRRSIEVQEAEFAQWLDIGEWGIEYDRKNYQLGRSGTQVFNHPGEMEVRISFRLFNNTARPLFIKSVRTLLAIGTEKVFKTFSTEESVTMPPKDEYRVVIDTILDKDQVTGYIAYMLPIEAAVEVNFLNALHKPEYAGFQRLVMCNAFDGITTVSKGHVCKEENRKPLDRAAG